MKKLVLEPTIYYVPIYCYRHWPSSDDIYNYINELELKDFCVKYPEIANKYLEIEDK